jgi:hypothetical protein
VSPSRPPGARVVTPARSPEDKPQETYIAVKPRAPRNVIVSFHQVRGEGSDHHPDVTVSLHVAASLDRGEPWSVADVSHPGYLRSIDAVAASDQPGHAHLAFIGLGRMRFSTRHGEFVCRSVSPLGVHPRLSIRGAGGAASALYGRPVRRMYAEPALRAQDALQPCARSPACCSGESQARVSIRGAGGTAVHRSMRWV